MIDGKEIKINWDYDLSTAKFEMDVLQDELLQFYLQNDMRFRRAMSLDFTSKFVQYIKDKCRLHEPTYISTIGHTRTFTDNNFIYTDKGWRNPSKMEGCKKVLSYNFDREKLEWKDFELINRIRDKKEKFYKITFTDNRSIEIGENHPIFTKDKGWRRGFSLKEGFNIPYYHTYPKKGTESRPSKSLVRVIACMLSCGHLNGSSYKSLDKRDGRTYNKINHSIGYCNSNKSLVEQFKKDFLKEFGIEMFERCNKRKINCIYLERCNKRIFYELSKYIPMGKKSHIIQVPKIIMDASRETQGDFISALFSGDGYVAEPRRQNLVEYYTMSKKFAEQLQLLLLSNGIISSLIVRYIKKRECPLFKVCITNKYNILAFKRFVKNIYNDKKDERLQRMVRGLYRLKKYLKPMRFKIRKKELLDVKDEIIYDIYVKDNNNFFLNGILTHNSGKSYSMMLVAWLMNYYYKRLMNIDYVCANSFEYVEKLQQMDKDKLNNSCFLIDEDKSGVFGVGSIAKRTKFTDMQNIIAKFNISNISLCPTQFANSEGASYGLRSFGRDFTQKINRFMLYNLQEGSKGGFLPMGCVYIPIFTKALPKEIYETLEADYIKKKDEWIIKETRGEGDVLYAIKKKSAEHFVKDAKFNEIKKKQDKLTYIAHKLGSEWTKNECIEILSLTRLILDGSLSDDN